MQRGNNVILGTGWVSELNPRKGVLTFDNGGHDERVLILASKVYIFERRLGARQYLSDVLTEGLNCVLIILHIIQTSTKTITERACVCVSVILTGQ